VRSKEIKRGEGAKQIRGTEKIRREWKRRRIGRGKGTGREGQHRQLLYLLVASQSRSPTLQTN
jgi:hypothetical protein